MCRLLFMFARVQNEIMENMNEIIEKISNSSKILIGIGENAGLEHDDYLAIATIVKDKDYFILSLAENADIEEFEFNKDRISLPLVDDNPERWEKYLKFLQDTINKDLAVIELEVGFKYPDVIRFPFEKTVFYNQKSCLIRVNSKFSQLTPEISERGYSIKKTPGEFLKLFRRVKFL